MKRWSWTAMVALAALASCTPDSEPDPATTPARAPATPRPDATLPYRPLVVGMTPQPGKQKPRDFEPFALYLSEAISHPVRVLVADDYVGAIEQIVDGPADFSLLSPLAYVRAKERLTGLRPLVSIMREGHTKYRGYIIVRADSSLATLADLEGKRFAFGAPSSTSGYLLPSALLRQAGIDPARDFAAVEHIVDHLDILERVKSGRADAGAVASTTFRLAGSDPAQPGVTIVAKSDWTTYDVMSAHPRIPETVAAKIERALLKLNTRTTEGRRILGGMVMINGFVPVEDSAYDSLRAMQKELAGTPDE